MSKSFQRSIFGVSLLLLLLTIWGSVRSGVRADQKDGAYQEMEVYSEVLNKIQNDYVVDPNMSNVTVGALHGLLESLRLGFELPDACRIQVIQAASERGHGAGRAQCLQALWLCDGSFRGEGQPGR